MRLINANTFRLDEFFDSTVPLYAILSHRWGSQEVSFQAFTTDLASARKFQGFQKIELACSQALEEKLSYVWVDTCCIDKSSSAELSEAINSMFRWYKQAEVCYAFLDDVPDSPEEVKQQSTNPDQPSEIVTGSFKSSEWWARGWTLQELLAPPDVKLFDKEWTYLGNRNALSMRTYISSITRIQKDYLFGFDPNTYKCCVARKLSWAAHRKTSRSEDMAYCLLGILDINMPLLYGEGDRAFRRLQEEVIRSTNDQSIFAWTDSGDQSMMGLLLAPHVSCFSNSGNISLFDCPGSERAFQLTNAGLSIRLPVIRQDDQHSVMILACRYDEFPAGPIGLFVRRHSTQSAVYSLCGHSLETHSIYDDELESELSDIVVLRYDTAVAKQTQSLSIKHMSELMIVEVRARGFWQDWQSNVHEADSVCLEKRCWQFPHGSTVRPGEDDFTESNDGYSNDEVLDSVGTLEPDEGTSEESIHSTDVQIYRNHRPRYPSETEVDQHQHSLLLWGSQCGFFLLSITDDWTQEPLSGISQDGQITVQIKACSLLRSRTAERMEVSEHVLSLCYRDGETRTRGSLRGKYDIQATIRSGNMVGTGVTRLLIEISVEGGSARMEELGHEIVRGRAPEKPAHHLVRIPRS